MSRCGLSGTTSGRLVSSVFKTVQTPFCFLHMVSVGGSPFVEELSLIERATCLAAIAIERCNQAGDHENRRIQAHRPVPEYVRRLP
jgi:hypothetical protein